METKSDIKVRGKRLEGNEMKDSERGEHTKIKRLKNKDRKQRLRAIAVEKPWEAFLGSDDPSEQLGTMDIISSSVYDSQRLATRKLPFVA